MDTSEGGDSFTWAIELFGFAQFTGFGSSREIACGNARKKAVSFMTRMAQRIHATQAQLIYDAVMRQWKSLKCSEDSTFMLAAFVVTSTVNPFDVRVLSMGSGTKWINSEFIKDNGEVLLDCHAEIIARRALLCFLYENLHQLAQNQGASSHDLILEHAPSGKGFRLKPHLKLHLYISSPPCGDARMFQWNAVTILIL